ncbi:hypothetical protein L1987_74948 [Smallanthus sonchifolius]|uniref:Uncharacterized protein n=1 Tax=Smallanthus sonchifolius TaxID=185202 RepID=A0ACB9A405_9ASTR|nr:hypothetical protein L1987_74948 [Smallanthus sonchifolius]
MEHDNRGGSGIIDEDSLDNDKIVGYPSSSSSSSSNQFEVDIGEDDASFLESPSMISTLPETFDLDTLYGSLKQSPPIQVMGQSAGYDVNHTPSSVFGPKHRSNSEWSLGSSESLFSIHTGNNSFSLDGGFIVSKSRELNWIDDYSCFTPDANKSCVSPGLPTVMDTSAENERASASTHSESGEKEEVIETRNVLLIGSEMEKRKSCADSANISCLSDASCQSTSSFAFPVLAGGSPSPTKVEAEKPQSPSSTPPADAAQTTPKAPPTIPKAGGNQWFHCFSCFPICC